MRPKLRPFYNVFATLLCRLGCCFKFSLFIILILLWLTHSRLFKSCLKERLHGGYPEFNKSWCFPLRLISAVFSQYWYLSVFWTIFFDNQMSSNNAKFFLNNYSSICRKFRKFMLFMRVTAPSPEKVSQALFYFWQSSRNSIITSPPPPLYQQYPLSQLKTFKFAKPQVMVWYGMIWYGMSLSVVTPTWIQVSVWNFALSFGCSIFWSFIHCWGR